METREESRGKGRHIDEIKDKRNLRVRFKGDKTKEYPETRAGNLKLLKGGKKRNRGGGDGKVYKYFVGGWGENFPVRT